MLLCPKLPSTQLLCQILLLVCKALLFVLSPSPFETSSSAVLLLQLLLGLAQLPAHVILGR